MQFEYPTEKEYLYNIKRPSGPGKYRTNIVLLGKTIYLMKRGFSPIILVCGPQRVGKSFFAVWFADKIINFFHNGEKFDIEGNTFYDPLNAIKKMGDKDYNVLIVDEAGAYLNKMEFFQKLHVVMSKIIQTQGYLKQLFIVISPFGADIDKNIRRHIDYIAYVRKRGVVVVKEIPKKYTDLSGKIPNPFMIEQIKIKKSALDPALWDIYEKYSMKKKEEIRKDLSIFDEFKKSKDPIQAAIWEK